MGSCKESPVQCGANISSLSLLVSLPLDHVAGAPHLRRSKHLGIADICQRGIENLCTLTLSGFLWATSETLVWRQRIQSRQRDRGSVEVSPSLGR